MQKVFIETCNFEMCIPLFEVKSSRNYASLELFDLLVSAFRTRTCEAYCVADLLHHDELIISFL